MAILQATIIYCLPDLGELEVAAMSSNFDKALDEAHANRSAVDAARAAEEREQLRLRNIARSVAEPYLRDLAPKVLQKLGELGIAPQDARTAKPVGPFGAFRRRHIRWWSFRGTSSYDYDHWATSICLLENGTFVEHAPVVGNYRIWDGREPNPVTAPLFRVDQVLAEANSMGSIYLPALGGFDHSQIFADPESRLVYIVPGDTTFSSVPCALQPNLHDPVQELSVYIANHIQYKHAK